jgi:rod shape-determining protein MreC
MRNRRLLVWVATALALIALQRASGWDGGEVGLRVGLWLRPLTQQLSRVAFSLEDWTGLHKAQRIAELRGQVERLRAAETEMLALRAENDRLRNLLALRHRLGPGQVAVSALVASRSSLSGSTDCVVDRGRVDGVRSSSVAICPAGLVGRVIDLGPSTARVRFASAPGSQVPALVVPGNGTGLVTGRGDGTLELSLVGPEMTVNPGDVVLTSGLGEVYPSGVAVGRIVRALPSNDNLSRLYLVDPAVDTSNLLEVLLLSPKA